MSEIQGSEGEAGFVGTTGWRCPQEVGVELNQRTSEGYQSFVSGAGGTQKKRKAVVRKVSADTQKYESCQLSDMVMDENKEEEEELHSQCGEQFGWMA